MAARRSRIAHYSVLIGLCCAVLAAQSTKSRAAEEQHIDSVHPGLISGEIYSNPFFGFSLEIPQDWKVADSAALRVLTERTKELLRHYPGQRYAHNGEVDSPLLIMMERKTDKAGQNHRLIRIQCTDVSQRPGQPAADDFLKSVAEMSLRYDPSMDYSSILEPATLGGREFWKTHFTQKGRILWYGEHFAIIDKKHVVQVILTSPDEAGLPGLEAILRTLHFDRP